MTDGTLVVGAYQSAGTPGDVEANLAEMLAAMDRAAAEGIELLVFPEGFLTGYYLPGVSAATLPATGGAMDRIVEHARAAGIAVVFGVLEANGASVFNVAVAISASGATLARYQKRALFGDWEKGLFTRGAGPVLFDYKGFRIGLLICFDVEFPELVRETAAAGTDLIVVPTSLMAPYDEVADHLLPTRAMENQIFVVYANRSGAEHDLRYVGKSSICNPAGQPLAKAGTNGPTTIKAFLDQSLVAAARVQFSYIDDLRSLPL